MLNVTIRQFSATAESSIRRHVRDLSEELQGEVRITTAEGKTKRVFRQDALPTAERAEAITAALSAIFARFDGANAPSVLRATADAEPTAENAAMLAMQTILRVVRAKQNGMTAGLPLQLNRRVVVEWNGKFINIGKVYGEAIRYDLMLDAIHGTFAATDLSAITAANLRALSEQTLPTTKVVPTTDALTERFAAFAAERAEVRKAAAEARKAAKELKAADPNA